MPARHDLGEADGVSAGMGIDVPARFHVDLPLEIVGVKAYPLSRPCRMGLQHIAFVLVGVQRMTRVNGVVHRARAVCRVHDLPVQVSAGRPAGVTRLADHVTLAHLVTLGHPYLVGQ